MLARGSPSTTLYYQCVGVEKLGGWEVITAQEATNGFPLCLIIRGYQIVKDTGLRSA